MQEPQRVLLVEPHQGLALRLADEIVGAGGEAVIVTSASAARGAKGTFDRAMCAFDLPDGSGIVLAAELLLDGRVSSIEFFHPADELVVEEPQAAARSVAEESVLRNERLDVFHTHPLPSGYPNAPVAPVAPVARAESPALR